MREYSKTEKYKKYHKEYRKEYYQRPEVKKHKKEYDKEFRKNNPEYLKKWKKENPEYQKEWRKKNPEKYREYWKEWTKNNPEKVRESDKKYRKNNPEKCRASRKEYERNKRANDPKFRLNHSITKAIWESLKGNKAGRKWETLVGYTLQDLIKHLESLFESWMTWDNYGEWVIDHIRPISLFNFTLPEDKEFKECWALENLQPLEAIANIKKSNNY